MKLKRTLLHGEKRDNTVSELRCLKCNSVVGYLTHFEGKADGLCMVCGEPVNFYISATPETNFEKPDNIEYEVVE